jgi:hypothetical protein
MRSNGSNLWRNRTTTKGLSDALLVVRTLVDVEPQENRVITAAILASGGDVICGHGTSFVGPNSYRGGPLRVNLGYGIVAPYSSIQRRG